MHNLKLILENLPASDGDSLSHLAKRAAATESRHEYYGVRLVLVLAELQNILQKLNPAAAERKIQYLAARNAIHKYLTSRKGDACQKI